ncbi:hypothetical protein HK101_010155 [Irineochytrium annulatum]|nr:hypothetical protein HK101_010155 [Irineochytrium annulatum]
MTDQSSLLWEQPRPATPTTANAALATSVAGEASFLSDSDGSDYGSSGRSNVTAVRPLGAGGVAGASVEGAGDASRASTAASDGTAAGGVSWTPTAAGKVLRQSDAALRLDVEESSPRPSDVVPFLDDDEESALTSPLAVVGRGGVVGDEDVDREAVQVVNDHIGRIGMGKYQWRLFFLCGFGWLNDNMWLQGISLAIQGVQKEFNVSSTFMGLGTRPPSHQNLLTLLSLFWPVGQLLASAIGWAVLPTATCGDTCTDPLIENRGWRRLLMALSAVTLAMLVARQLAVTMLESPKFLVSRGRRREAAEVLASLAEVNGWKGMAVTAEDLGAGRRTAGSAIRRSASFVRRPAAVTGGWRGIAEERWASTKDGLRRWRAKLYSLFKPDLIRTTVLVWIIWSLISCGYTMFNGFLTFFLESGPDSTEPPPTSDETFRDIFIISVMGVPGSILGMFLIETRLGRRYTMSLSSFGTAASLFLFTITRTRGGQLLASCLAAVLQNVMYGVLYCYTPEVFDSQVRGTATGVAGALSRVFGTAAPLLTGALWTIGPSVPLYVAALLIAGAASCMVFLPIETKGRQAL